MPRKKSKFTVDGKITKVLGENYRSVEAAIKELIDNAWDADATIVEITLPTSMTENSIITIKDNGIGMTPVEVESEYLRIARDKRSIKGNRTEKYDRRIKGRKGIGKFAGFITAQVMEVSTTSGGIQTNFCFDKDTMMKQADELERFEIDLYTTKTESPNGTIITLSQLDLCLLSPNSNKLKELLILDYCREESFDIYINGIKLDVEHIGGTPYNFDTRISDIGEVNLRFNITDKDITYNRAGITLRVDGKIIGSPSFYGVNESSDIPPKLLKRIYGEVVADGLTNYINPDWNGVIENRIGYKEMSDFINVKVTNALKENFNRQISVMKARIKRQVNEKLKQLPEHKKDFATKAIERVLNKFYSEPEHKINTIINVMLEAIERDEYYKVVDEVNKAKHKDVIDLSEALNEFGLADISILIKQAVNRMTFLNNFTDMIRKEETTELEVHKALESNLWIFGSQYTLISSNETNKMIIDSYLGSKYTGSRGKMRPDLLLCNQYGENYLLIEFKKPDITIKRQNETQVQEYRDDLKQFLMVGTNIEIFLIGGKINKALLGNDSAPSLKTMTYDSIISRAKSEIDWLLENIMNKPVEL